MLIEIMIDNTTNNRISSLANQIASLWVSLLQCSLYHMIPKTGENPILLLFIMCNQFHSTVFNVTGNFHDVEQQKGTGLSNYTFILLSSINQYLKQCTYVKCCCKDFCKHWNRQLRKLNCRLNTIKNWILFPSEFFLKLLATATKNKNDNNSNDKNS